MALPQRSSRRLLLKTALSVSSGYGRDGIGIAQAFMRAGWDVCLRPTGVEPPLPPDIAMLLTKAGEGDFDLMLNHADPSSLGLHPGEGRSARKKVAWTMWEFTGLGPDFEGKFGPPDQQMTMEERLDTYDTLVVYDEVSKQALAPRTPQGTEILKLQGGYDADEVKLPIEASTEKRDWSGTFRFCMVGQLHQRKNPFAAIEAFDLLKKQHGDEFDAELHLKNSVRTLHPKIEQRYPGVKIHYEPWSRGRLLGFYLECHCLLAPSWGEGKNLPALEAMTSGIPVIATRFGGHAEWMSPDWSYPIEFMIGEHVAGMGSARASVEDLATKMWHVYTHREEARRKGELAARVIPAMQDWDKVVERLCHMLEV